MIKYQILFLFIFISCTDTDIDPVVSNNPNEPNCTIYRDCQQAYEGRFCTNGNKFGENNQFENFGVDQVGPISKGNVVTYSFQTSGTYPTVFFGEFQSRTFGEIGIFAKDKIREALAEWESHIDIILEETTDEENSILKIICADINDKAGIGYSTCTDMVCAEMIGYVFFKNNPISEENFYSLALHEVGHALGLCHSSPSNIMSYNSKAYDYNTLQAGDIEGIISIYGAKN